MFTSKLAKICARKTFLGPRKIRKDGRLYSSLPETSWRRPILTEERMNHFRASYQDLVKALTSEDTRTNTSEGQARLVEAMDYLLPCGKHMRASLVISVCESLCDKVTPERMKIANWLGWIMELNHVFILIVDDIVDSSAARRNKAAWHQRENIGMSAVLDAFILEHCTFSLLKKHFSHEPFYVPLWEQLSHITRECAKGKLIEKLNHKFNKPLLNKFTMDRWRTLAELKTSIHSFHLPIIMGMYGANVYDKKAHDDMWKISKKLGLLYQIQDDFFDCFGNPKKPDRNGEDVRESKFSWMAVKCLEKADIVQRKRYEEYYGSDDPKAVDIVLDLYEELNLPKENAICVEQLYNDLKNDIQKLPHGANLQKAMLNVVETFYTRY